MAPEKGNTATKKRVAADDAFEVGDERGPRFGMIYFADMDTDEFRELSGAAVRCYVLLTTYAGSGMASWPRQTTMRRVLGVHVVTVQNALRELEKAGFLRRENLDPDGWRRKYVLTRPPSRR